MCKKMSRAHDDAEKYELTGQFYRTVAVFLQND